MKTKTTPTMVDRVRHAAATYPTNGDAASSLGLLAPSFVRLCKKYRIELPAARRDRHWQAARGRA